MIKKDLRRMLLPAALILVIAFSPMFGVKTASAARPEPFFEISILGPNSNPSRNQWITIMSEQWPKIGIGIDVFDHTSWAQIYPRTWDYPGPYPIPTYAEGGYDLFFVGMSWDLDWDPTGLFDTEAITPYGDNVYQYSSADYDAAMAGYTSSFLLAERLEYAKEIQAILFEDLPSLTIAYDRQLYAFTPDLSGWDPLLWTCAYQPMEQWSIEGSTALHYAMPADFVDFHILLYESVYDAYWLRQIYNGLIERESGTRELVPRICTSYDTTDGLTWTFNLDPNAKWADGTDITADDVVFTYQSIMTPGLAGTGYSTATRYLSNDTVTAVDEDTVQFVLSQPYAFAEPTLFYQDIIPKHIWESIPIEEWGQQAVDWAKDEPSKLFGCGPYKLKSWDTTNGIIALEKNPYFHELAAVDESILDEIYFIFYSNKEGAMSDLVAGNVDIVDTYFGLIPSDVEGTTGIDSTLVASPGYQEISLNMLNPYFGTGESCPIAGAESGKALRNALSHMIPREIIIEEILEGLGAPGITSYCDACVGFDDTLVAHEYSIEKAKDFMREAGYEFPEDTETSAGGIGLVVIMSILALAGASQIILLKRRK